MRPDVVTAPPPTVAAPAADEGLLVERARRGDLEAFDALVVRFMEPAFGVAMRVMRQREDAEDLVQESFIQALRMLGRFESGRPFAPWFFRILVNRGLNLRRSRSIRSTEQIPEDAPAPQDSPARSAERTELRERLRLAIDQLPDRERMILELFELEGFDSAEISQILDIPRGTVRWHLHQARQTLRERLQAFQGSGT